MILVSKILFKIQITPYLYLIIHQVSYILILVANGSMLVNNHHPDILGIGIFSILLIGIFPHILKTLKILPSICLGLKRIFKKIRKISLKILGIIMILILIIMIKNCQSSVQKDM